MHYPHLAYGYCCDLRMGRVILAGLKEARMLSCRFLRRGGGQSVILVTLAWEING